MLVAIKYNSTQITQQTLSLPSPRNPVVTVRLGEEEEKRLRNKVYKKRGMGIITFASEREVRPNFLKTKTTGSHKVIYFQKNKLYKIWLCICFPMLVENIEFKVTKITYIQVTTIL